MPKNLRQVRTQQIAEFLCLALDFTWDELNGMNRSEMFGLLDDEDRKSLLVYAANPNPLYA